MAKMTEDQRMAVLQSLARGVDRETIARQVGVTPGQVSAMAAHVTMGTYCLPAVSPINPVEDGQGTLSSLIERLPMAREGAAGEAHIAPILLGKDVESNEETFWNPDPRAGSVNPHVLVLGESGFGKTYTISCLLTELSRQGVTCVVFDYGQGFSLDTVPEEFVQHAHPLEIHASRDGIDINPLQIFPSDVHGPVNVAQRVADTFSRVYRRLGIQQHAVLRQAILDVMEDAGISGASSQDPKTVIPSFDSVHGKLDEFASNPHDPQGRIAKAVASHISTIFVYNTFRPTGLKLAWGQMLKAETKVFIIQLKGLEYSLERAVTEFLLWNLIGFIDRAYAPPFPGFSGVFMENITGSYNVT